jgi:hypothetical protein
VVVAVVGLAVAAVAVLVAATVVINSGSKGGLVWCGGERVGGLLWCLPPTSQHVNWILLCVTVSTLKPMVGMVVTTSPSFILYLWCSAGERGQRGHCLSRWWGWLSRPHPASSCTCGAVQGREGREGPIISRQSFHSSVNAGMRLLASRHRSRKRQALLQECRREILCACLTASSSCPQRPVQGQVSSLACVGQTAQPTHHAG